jgi:hypothetical protein
MTERFAHCGQRAEKTGCRQTADILAAQISIQFLPSFGIFLRNAANRRADMGVYWPPGDLLDFTRSPWEA